MHNEGTSFEFCYTMISQSNIVENSKIDKEIFLNDDKMYIFEEETYNQQIIFYSI